MSIASRLGKLEKEVNKTDEQPILIIGRQGSWVGTEKDITAEELEQIRRTGNKVVLRDGVEEWAQ